MRIFDMNVEQVKAAVVQQMYSSEGHIADGVKSLERIKRKDKNVSITVLLPKFKLSYPQLVEAKEGEYKGKKTDPRYSCVAIFDPEDIKGLYPFWRASYALAVSYLGKKAEAFCLGINNGTNLIKANEDYLASREEKGKDTSQLDGLYKKGGAYMNLSRAAKKGPVLLVGKDRKPMDKETAVKELYAGAICQATVEIFAMEDKLAMRVVAVIKVGEGERISGAAKASVSDFDSVSIMDDSETSDMLAGLDAQMNDDGSNSSGSGSLFG